MSEDRPSPATAAKPAGLGFRTGLIVGAVYLALGVWDLAVQPGASRLFVGVGMLLLGVFWLALTFWRRARATRLARAE